MRVLVLILTLSWLALIPTTAQAAPSLTLQPPVDGALLRPFDGGSSPYSAGHRGVDLAASPGAEVRAAADGVVSFAGSVAGRPSVSITHSGTLRTTYTPVDSAVRVGERVSAGQVIGTLSPQRHCEEQDCLHWGLTDGSQYFDPLDYLAASSGGPLRLLPAGTRPSPPPLLSSASWAGSPGELPVAGRVTSRFGMRRHPITGVYKLHDGVDLAAACGTPVHVPWAGEVVSAQYHRSYGYRVIVQHDGLRSAYTHLQGVEVRSGQRLAAGQSVGRVGNTGLSTGCHLHWMAWQAGRLVDPLTLV